MPSKLVAAPSGLHLHSCLSALPRLAKAGEIERVNAQFARVEQVKQFRIIDRILMPEDEKITPTMKLKREPVPAPQGSCFFGPTGLAMVRRCFAMDFFAATDYRL